MLAKGERRNFVVVDIEGGVHSLSRRIGKIRAQSLSGYFGVLPSLPSVAEAREMQRKRKRARGEAGSGDVQPIAFDLKAVEGDLLGTRSFFSLYQLEQLLKAKGCLNIPETIRDILADARLLRLTEQNTGRLVGFTTREVRAQEERILELADQLSRDMRHRVREAVRRYVTEKTGLSLEQAEALRHALDPGGLKLIEGRAGTGKSYLLSALHDAASMEGYDLIGLAPTNAVASDLAKAGFEGARTVHSLLWWMENRPDHLNAKLHARSMLVVDEAAMLSTEMTERLLSAAGKAGAKVILVGDSRQLASVERGGIYADLSERHGAASLTTIHRQREDWSKDAATAFATGQFEEGLKAYDRKGLIRWSNEHEDAKDDLIKAWARDTANGDTGKRLVFAYTNKDVDSLNSALHKIEVERGRVTNMISVETTRGQREFGTGDRIQFRSNDKPSGILNGGLGTITGVEGKTLHVKTDAGRMVSVDTDAFKAIDHGYAGTIYRGQGKTLDQSYVLHSHHWRDASSYVAMTRARQDTQLFVARSHAENIDALARQMQRRQNLGSTLKYNADDVAGAREKEALRPPMPNASKEFKEQVGKPRASDSNALEPRADFNRLSMTLDLKDGLEQLKLQAKQIEERQRSLDAFNAASAKAPEQDRAALREAFLRADAAHKDAAARTLDEMKARQADERNRLNAETKTPERSNSSVQDEKAMARQRQIDEMKQKMLDRLRRDRNRGRDREL